MLGLIASRPKCSSVVSTRRLSHHLLTVAASPCKLVITAVGGRRQCTATCHTSRLIVACRLHHAGHSHFRYRRRRATSRARYTARPTCTTTTILSCHVEQLHATPLQTALISVRRQHWMLRRTVGKVFRACLSQDRGTYLERRCRACPSLWMRQWSCRLITHTLHVKAR